MDVRILETLLPGTLKKLEKAIRRLAEYVHFNHCLFAAVFVLAAVSFWLSFELRFDFNVPPAWSDQRLLVLPYAAALKLILFYILRGHSSDWRYVGVHDVPRLAVNCALSSIIFLLLPQFGKNLVIPRGVIAIDFFLSFVLIGGARISLRILREQALLLIRRGDHLTVRPAVIIGAGDAGEMIVREIARNPFTRLKVKAFFDDDRSKRGLSIHGVPVVGAVADVQRYVLDHGIRMAVIAIPSANQTEMKRIYGLLKDLEIPIKTLPSMHELIVSSSKLMQLRDIDITDLLGREEVRIDTEQVRSLIQGKVVFVTGAGGSIGSELCRQVLRRGPARLVLLERAENSLYHIHRQLKEQIGEGAADVLVPVLCDVQDKDRVAFQFERFRPDLVLHAAAYKHVPMQEYQSAECFRNNVGATCSLVRLSHTFGVSRFLLISTDKAVNPTSVMGATKRVCEIYCSAFGRMSETKFLSVRFGNVLASEGSVVPLFLEQIARGGPITVTHPEIRRYFMTIPEATTLVLQAAALGDSGQILVLDMGEPIKLVDMAHQLIQLVGKKPEEISIEFVGLRPGEKMTEELAGKDAVLLETPHSKIKIYDDNREDYLESITLVERAMELVNRTTDGEEVRAILKELAPEYQPWSFPGKALEADTGKQAVGGARTPS